MNHNKNINSGFTLIEMIVNLSIVSAVMLSLFLAYNKLQTDYFDIETNRREALNYANAWVEEIAKELKTADSCGVREINGVITIEMRYPDYNNEQHENYKKKTRFRFDPRNSKSAFIKQEFEGNAIGSAKETVLPIAYNNDFKNVEGKRKKYYEIIDFEIEDRINSQDSWLNAQHKAVSNRLRASYMIKLDIIVFNQYGDDPPLYDQSIASVEKIRKRIFSPAKFIKEINKNL